jgi:GntR family transcriptional regulator/MocR family aminotransferase
MRRAEDKELAIAPRPEGVTRQAWLYAEIRAAILAGRLAAGTRLPASRDFAQRQGLARGTIQAVFAQLVAEGYLVGEVGRGTFVSDALPPTRKAPAKAHAPADAAHDRLSRRGKLLAQTPFMAGGRPDPARAFRPNQPDLTLFPFALWNRIAARRARLSQRALLSDGEALGYLPLRQAIAERLRYAMRIDTRPEQIAIIGSVQQAFDLCSRLLLDPGEVVWMEDPGYPGATRIFESNGARVVGVPVDASGLDVAAGMQRAPDARLVYVTPSRQTPLGMAQALDRRLALLHWAERTEAVVIEDDYDSEYRFSGNPLAALKSLDKSGRVIYAGTFSKLLFPSLRLAYVVLPDWLTEPFAQALSVTSRHQSLLPQVVLHEFMAEGHFGRHIRRMRTLYGERAAAFQEAVSLRLGEWLTLPAIAAGIDTVAMLPQCADDRVVARALLEAGIETRPLSAYKVTAEPPAGLVLGFAPFQPATIRAGVEAMAAALARIRF